MSAFIKAAVIGHPVKHSKSPLIHNYWIKKYGLNGSYEAIDLAPENLKNGLKALVEEGYTGFNFTIPHKEKVIALCDILDASDEKIGAINALSIKSGKLHGFNTDGFGFLANIKTAYPDFKFDDGAAVVLGAGGAARAIISGLMDENVPEIILINRTREKAQNLADEMGGNIRVLDWDDRSAALKNANLLVNTTSLGMNGQPALEIDLSALPPSAMVNDIVYAPLYTDLLKSAQNNGNRVVTGIGMLIHQARPAFKEWFGVMPDITDELEKLVLK